MNRAILGSFRSASALALAGHVFLSSVAAAQGLMPPPDAVCVALATDESERRVLDPSRLIRWAISTAAISDAALDANGDGDTLLIEKQLALTQPGYCAAAPTRGCTEADARALRSLQDGLRTFVAAEGGALYHFERIRRPDPLDLAGAPALDPDFETPDQPFHLGEVLDPAARFVRVHCQAVEAAPAPDAGAPRVEAEQPAAPEPPPSPQRGLLDDFRLTRDIDDLGKDRTRLRDVKAAEFSISGNLREDRTSYQVNAIAGYHFLLEQDERARVATIPFVQLERFFDGSRHTVDKLGFGLQLVGHVQAPTVGIHELAITPVFLTDTSLDSAIGTLKLRWTPALTEEAPVPLGFYRRYGPIMARIGFDALADSGRVFDPGDKETLEDESAFLRIGGQLGLRLSGAPDTLLAQFEIDVANKYLYNVNADIEHIDRFEAGLSYLFPGYDNYKLSFRYTAGRTEDTLERIELWKTQLGIRF